MRSGSPVKLAGMLLTDHEVEVPLDHAHPGGETIVVFAREVAALGGADRPYLVYLQGGPGHEAGRPTASPISPGWLERALADYRVLLLDQRGTGRSTPVGDLPGLSPERQAEYLSHFRADSIVADLEIMRRELKVDRWSLLGQSFGGFCALTYLSAAPEALGEVFFTGGLPPVGRGVDEVYEATYQRMAGRNERYYSTYPEDRERVLQLHHRLEADPLILPGGDRLSSRRLRQLGIMLGMSDGAERLHYLIERPFDSPAFRHDLELQLEFARNPLYAIIHEACYADGVATRWSAERVLPPRFGEQPELFTGEHVFSWMFFEYGALRPLREAAHRLAEWPWPRLYDPSVLRANRVPAAAAIFADDAYVERRFSEETAELVRGLRPWVTNEYQHNALRVDGARVLDRLIKLARGLA
jgi:pimeloyl-ACP methyl ester carboxylesterase